MYLLDTMVLSELRKSRRDLPDRLAGTFDRRTCT